MSTTVDDTDYLRQQLWEGWVIEGSSTKWRDPLNGRSVAAVDALAVSRELLLAVVIHVANDLAPNQCSNTISNCVQLRKANETTDPSGRIYTRQKSFLGINICKETRYSVERYTPGH